MTPAKKKKKKTHTYKKGQHGTHTYKKGQHSTGRRGENI